MSLEYPVSWRLRQCMQAAGIASVTELHEKIRAICILRLESPDFSVQNA